MSNRGFTSRGIAVDSVEHKVVVWYDGLSMTNITRNPTSQCVPNSTSQIFMCMQCKPDLGTMEPDDMYALLERLHPSQPEDPELWAEIGHLVELSLVDLFRYVEANPIYLQGAYRKPWKQHYLHWARHHMDKCTQKRLHSGLELNATDSQLHGKKIGWQICANDIGIDAPIL
ncbi:hypothetical protein M406DRAFT_102242 [Cryphonectria parasitica EP155]|uniref:Uncharacterized protein n=1 Tax=Cryphonectria parasitica (strain ATCC 38755 / EP155) TaxID=660469 RepID=A0A9P4Y7I5_CRYP1|nr:uncharacterized protein M406DRAFT_102242 [Cryphonectria parasitica EP155]KAF3768166.1 hypothetical protein M406DRAFT_102242 [Cryphonectria parasitica EP155]